MFGGAAADTTATSVALAANTDVASTRNPRIRRFRDTFRPLRGGARSLVRVLGPPVMIGGRPINPVLLMTTLCNEFPLPILGRIRECSEPASILLPDKQNSLTNLARRQAGERQVDQFANETKLPIFALPQPQMPHVIAQKSAPPLNDRYLLCPHSGMARSPGRENRGNGWTEARRTPAKFRASARSLDAKPGRRSVDRHAPAEGARLSRPGT